MQIKTELCPHCPKNPEAKEPFIKTKRLPLTSLADKAIDYTARELGVKRECALCLVVSTYTKTGLPEDLKLMRAIVEKERQKKA